MCFEGWFRLWVSGSAAAVAEVDHVCQQSRMSLVGLWRITRWAGFMVAAAAVADSSLVALLFQSNGGKKGNRKS